ncbi:serine hydrolase domain-containing protein [Clostridium sp. 'White wine YQ']|uniref:serine hydrolase domain-containing protein n=1 Tax=Clostridium sp. 'White wine YQ' TaxID=3027474 RepID=UPI0023661166|nr:serine hydrolase domain-containing protein [Clostridium sp. 'White wine YQ']MDD7794291.1 serine hydrolase [Clostridium sp. 'White wine YQ']
MKRKISIISTLLITFTLLLTGCSNNKADTIETVNKDKDKDETYLKLENYMKKYSNFNGTVLVAKNEKILFENGYGMANAENKIQNTPKTVFRIASITKQFTATAILMLQEKGLLNVQDTIDKYIENYPNGNKIKIYNLLNHTSGIPEYIKFISSDSYTPEKLVELFKDKKLNFTPGTKYEYSNSNYVLLGYIIEKVSGMSYENYMEENIFKPLKLESTGTLNNMDRATEKAEGYAYINHKSNQYQKDINMDPSLAYAAGNLYSNAEDLLVWNNNLCSGKLINDNSLKEMLTPYQNGYGFGWFIINKDNQKLIEHEGDILGFTSLIRRDMNTGYVVILLSNKRGEGTNLKEMCDGLFATVSNK